MVEILRSLASLATVPDIIYLSEYYACPAVTVAGSRRARAQFFFFKPRTRKLERTTVDVFLFLSAHFYFQTFLNVSKPTEYGI